MLAIIPARGGSKRLPGKNIKLLNGKPLIAYTIEAALQSRYITKVVVSTDCEEIAKIAEQFGAIVPGLRPEALSIDTASSNDVVKYIIEKMEFEHNIEVNNCVLLQPTSPFRTVRHIDEAIELYKEKSADAVISFTKEFHPLKWNKYLNEDGVLQEISCLDNRSSYFPNGSIYVLSRDVVLSGNYYTSKSYAYLIDRKYASDIDTQEDWDYVEFLSNMERYYDDK
jgi:CMP-N,N'-diacetyllegionaminic acid synthase